MWPQDLFMEATVKPLCKTHSGQGALPNNNTGAVTRHYVIKKQINDSRKWTL